MPRGRKTSFTPRLTPAQRQTFMEWQRATSVPYGVARRGRMMLLLADGMTITDIAPLVGMSRKNIYKWIHRFVQEGVEGLQNKPRHNRHIEPRLSDLADQGDVDIVY